MERSMRYIEKARWVYPEKLMNEIISEIDLFYKQYNVGKKGHNKISRFNNEPAFQPLKNHIALKSKFSSKEIPDLGWLQDLYNKKKHGKGITITFFESLLKTFGYQYDAESDTFNKKQLQELKKEDVESQERENIINFFASKSKSDTFLSEFIGAYKYFVAGRKEDTRYDYIYENKIIIHNNRQIEVINPFNGHTYTGVAILKTDSCLQLISFDFDNQFLDGIGNLLTFKINKYAKKVKLIPGISTSFDADGRIILSQAVLCTELELDKKSPIIREYFDKIIKGLRLYSPEIKDVERLVVKYYK